MTPCRVVDTRASSMFPSGFGQPSLTSGVRRDFPIQSSTLCTIPSTAEAYSFNVTVIPPGTLGYLTLWPEGQSQPTVVTLDDITGDIRNNAAIVPAGTPNGGISAITNGTTDLVLDINGYYAPQNTVSTGNSSTPSGSNTAYGYGALASYTTGTENTANGFFALYNNTTGTNNTAGGYAALLSNFTGSFNTATGTAALSDNNGDYNTANGNQALTANTTGVGNTASGASALFSNTTGGYNTASGQNALFYNTAGSFNTAVGVAALGGTQGMFNTALGYGAGGGIFTGSYNIDIGNIGKQNDGTTANSGVIRIGDSAYQTAFFAAGILGVTTGLQNTVEVMIDGNGQLGTVSSSRRFKEDIQDMNDASSGVLRLRPVTYRYQKPYADGSKPIDYGLIAEEVAEVYPDLVVKGADGQIETVQYQKLTPMLLNELQKLHTEFSALEKEHKALQEAMRSLLANQRQSSGQ